MTRNVKTIHGHQATGNCGPTEGVRKCTLLGVNASSRFGHYILRLAAVLILMVVGVSSVKAQTDYSGTYYIANKIWNGDHDQATEVGNEDYYYSSSKPDKNWYLVPARNPHQANKEDAFYSSDSYATSGDPAKPFLTTNRTNRDNNSIWIITKTGNKYLIKHFLTGKYLKYEPPVSANLNRRSVHLEAVEGDTPPTANEFLFTITTKTENSISGYNIKPTKADGTDAGGYLNPAGDNWPYYYCHKQHNDNIWCLGIVGYYNNTGGGSLWVFEDVDVYKYKPDFSLNTDNQIVITYPDNNYDAIYYTTDGSEPPTSGDEHKYTVPFNPPANATSIQAVAVKDGVASPVSTYSLPFFPGSTHKYIFQSKSCKFYNMIPNLSVDANTKNVSTLNVPSTTMAWHFEYAADEDGQYYYIVSETENSEKWYMYYTSNTQKHIYLKNTKDNSDNYKFNIDANPSGGYNLIPKGQAKAIYKNIFGTSSDGNAGLKPVMFDGNIADAVARWDIIPYSVANLPQWDDQPFTESTNNDTKYYKIVSVGVPTCPLILNNDGLIKSESIPPSGYDERKAMWVIKNVDSDADGLLDFYTFQNAYTGELLYYNGARRETKTDTGPGVLQMGKPTSEGALDSWSYFAVVQTVNGYNIIPSVLVDKTKAINTGDNHEGFNCINRANGSDVTGAWYDNDDGSRWTFTKVDDDVKCMEPVFTEEANGDITITTVTNAAKILYTVDNTEPTNSSHEYTTKENTSAQKVIKAIAIMGDDASTASNVVTLLNKPDITLTTSSYEYDGTAKTFEKSNIEKVFITINEVEISVAATTYDVDGFENNIKAATPTDANPPTVTLKDDVDGDVWYIWNASKTFTITPKPLTITADSDSKVYDGTALTNDGYTNTDLADGDVITSVTVTGSQMNAGTSDNVPSAAVIEKDDEDMTANYNITYVDGTLEVTAKAVTITAKDASRAYNGSALTENDFETTALETGDEHTFTVVMTVGSTITDVGTQPNVIATVDGVAVTTGNEAAVGNYLVTTADGTLTINPKKVTITANDATKEYDSTPLTESGFTATDLEEGDTHAFTVTITAGSTITGVGDEPNVIATVDGTAVTTGTETAIGNYLVTTADGTLTISKRGVTVSGITAEDKVYDGTTVATLVTTGATFAQGNIIGGEELKLISGTGTFDTKNVGTDKTVTITDLTLGGANAGNYVFAASEQQTTATASITAKSITAVSGIAAVDKEYDGTTTADFDSEHATLTGMVEGDDLTVTATGAFVDKNVGEGKTVNISGLALDGNDAGNYELAASGQQTTATASITPRSVSVSGITAANKVYDGTTDATLVMTGATIAEGSIIAEEELTLVSGTGAFETPDADTDKTVTITALTFGGAHAGNYQFTTSGQLETITADITPAPLTITAKNNSITYGEAPANDGVTYGEDDGDGGTIKSFVGGEDETVLDGTLAFSYNSEEDGQGTAYTTEDIIPMGTTCYIIPGGLTSTNYVITFVPGTLTINGKSIGNGSLATDFTISFDQNNDVILMDGETQLNEGTDYTIDAEATISASGRYSVRTIHGIGNYGGTASIRNAIISFANDGNGGSEYSATFVAESANPDAEPDPEKGHELPDGVTAYIITGINGNAVNAVALSYIPEGVPVLLLSNAALSGFLVHDVSGQTLPSGYNLLKEVTEESQHFDVKTIYLLYKNEFAYNKAGDLAKGNVYLDPAPSSPSGARLVINWGAENGINTSLLSPLASPLSEVWHSLDGRRLSDKPTMKGLYIRNGQIVVIK